MGWMRKKKKKDIIRLEKESVIPILKSKLISSLSHLIENKDDRVEFLKFCKRVDSAIRAWYFIHFEDLLQLYTLFDPVHGAHPQNLSPEDIDNLEHVFLTHLFQVLEKGNFKISTDEEIYIALSAQYRLNLPIIVDESKLDRRLLRGFFANNPHADLPFFAEKYLIFRRGVGIDRHTAFFIKAKINTIIARSWRNFLKYTGLKRFFSRKPRNPRNKSPTEPTEVNVGREGDDDMFVERIHIENMKLGICKLLSRNTIQEPTFERIIVLYRRASSETDQDRNIYVKHFKNIPMADLEIVLVSSFTWIRLAA
ncbi:hypothetical protein SAY87_019772 [Trapa incisa]|uniref:Uncharacterized protein n=1 Tax=Trapa incisa TaxID=236973 RepID=A0AAN7K2E4_9MYRT|nr:hypothetical protein SAY87_019772 [Trapa incisa]